MLYPRSLGNSAPGLTGVSATGGKVAEMELGNLIDLAWLQDGSADDIQFSGPTGTVTSDGRFGLIRYDGTRVAGYNVQDGTGLTAGKNELFTATEPIDMSLEITLTEVDGFVRGPESGYTINPLRLAFDASRTRLAVLEWEGFLQVFDARVENQRDGDTPRYITKLGRWGSSSGEFVISPPTAVDVLVDANGRIYVADAEERIQVFAP